MFFSCISSPPFPSCSLWPCLGLSWPRCVDFWVLPFSSFSLCSQSPSLPFPSPVVALVLNTTSSSPVSLVPFSRFLPRLTQQAGMRRRTQIPLPLGMSPYGPTSAPPATCAIWILKYLHQPRAQVRCKMASSHAFVSADSLRTDGTWRRAQTSARTGLAQHPCSWTGCWEGGMARQGHPWQQAASHSAGPSSHPGSAQASPAGTGHPHSLGSAAQSSWPLPGSYSALGYKSPLEKTVT